MTTNDKGGPRRAIHETAGSVDHPRDRDEPGSHQLIHTDAACTVPWRADGREAVAVFIDPALRDRMQVICQTIAGLCDEHRDLDSLNAAVQDYARRNELSAGLHDEPRDAISQGLVAVTFTLG